MRVKLKIKNFILNTVRENTVTCNECGCLGWIGSFEIVNGIHYSACTSYHGKVYVCRRCFKDIPEEMKIK